MPGKKSDIVVETVAAKTEVHDKYIDTFVSIQSLLESAPGALNISLQILQPKTSTFSLGEEELTPDWKSFLTANEISAATLFKFLSASTDEKAERLRRVVLSYLITNIGTALSLRTVYTIALLSTLDVPKFVGDNKLTAEEAVLSTAFFGLIRSACEHVALAFGYASMRDIFSRGEKSKKSVDASSLKML